MNKNTIKLTEEFLLEVKRQGLIDKSKKSDNYKDMSKGRNRWERRTRSRISTSVADYNRIDMNAFWKGDMLEFGIKVAGETDDYVVTILFENIIKEIARQIKDNKNKLEFRCILRALIKVFNSEDVYVHCTCLHPDTKIKLLDGTAPTVEEMKVRFEAGEKLYVFSVDEKGDFKPGEVENVWITKTTKEFIKITLDNGKEILTTPDHRYMLRDGSYKPAYELKKGQSLMPLYMKKQAGYPIIKLNSKPRGWKSLYKLVAQYYKQKEIEETKLKVNENDNMPYDVAIHHIDFNKDNNNPENLQIIANMTLRRSQFDEVFSVLGVDKYHNHKIVKIEYIQLENTPVYDIAVKEWHNFTLDAGVIVHNCADFKYRQAYWASKGNYNSGPPQFDPGKGIVNPNDTKGAGCKHVNLVLANLDWIMKIASVINNYIYYCKDHMENNYAQYIFPRLYNMHYEKAIQLTLTDYDDEGELSPDLTSDEETINLSNALGRRRTQYKKLPQPSVNPRFKKPKTEEPETNVLGLKFKKTDDEEDEIETDVEVEPAIN